MSTPSEVSDPPMRVMWQNTKKTAEKLAKTKKADKAYKTLAGQFNLDLGPNLKKWPGFYPNLGKMNTEKMKLEGTITKYEKFVKDAKGKVDKAVLAVLNDGLNDLRLHLANRKAIADSTLLGDEDQAIQRAVTESLKTPLKPVVVFNFPDLSGTIMKMVPKAKPIVEINKLQIQVILSDDDVLKKCDDADGNMGEKIRNAADAAQLKKDIAVAYRAAAVSIKADADNYDSAESTFEDAVQAAIQNATARASAEMNRLAKVRVAYRNYRIVAGVKLTATIVGTAAGAASLALAPFTGPAMVVSAAGVLKGAKVIGDQIADLSMSGEEMIRELKTDVGNLQKRYSEWKGAGIGTAEVGSTLVNAIAPTILPTIKRCASHCDTANSKIDGMETKASDLYIKLNNTLDAQQKAEENIQNWIRDNKQAVTGNVKKSAVKLMNAMKSNREQVTQLIDKITDLNGSVDKARADLGKIDKQIKALSSREPTIAKFAEVFIEVGATVGFLTSANVGWPDAYQITTTAKSVTDMVGNIVGSLDGAVGAAEEMKGFVDDLRG